MSGADITRLRSALLTWYDRAKRELPWRERAHDPYAIWVSEVMLQQTRVDTVLPYYARFMARFPSLEVLAAASEDEVLASWSGLGYYRRARMLHHGVREVVERYGGEVPRDPLARLSLPGVGRYTAGALGSVCFGLEEPIVDGNVARILTRLFGIGTPLPDRVTQKLLWDLAEQLVVGERPGDFNQAMMELGALVCTVKSPDCSQCPARDLCSAHADDLVQELPRIPRKTPPRPTSLVAVVPMQGNDVALVRGDKSLFGGLYGLPMAPLEAPGGRAELKAAAQSALKAAGVRGRVEGEPLGDVHHVLSHRRLQVSVFSATDARIDRNDSARMLPLDTLGQLASADVGIAKLTQKVLALAAEQSARQVGAKRQRRRAQTK